MKIHIIISFILLSLTAKAQSPIISLQAYGSSFDVIDGTYAKDLTNYYTPFIGNWKWESGSDELEIKFEKISQVYDGEIYMDYLIGKYKYTKNGVVLHNSLSYPITNLNYSKYSYTVFTGLGFYKNIEVFSLFDDLQKKQQLQAFFTLISPTVTGGILTSNTIKMTTSLITQFNFTGNNSSLSGLNYPEQILLVRQ